MRARPNPRDAEADLALARRCLVEPAARDELVRQFAPVVYRLARRLLGSRTDAEDLVQEVFIDVLASIHSFRGEAPLGSWIYRIAVRRAMRHRRRPAPNLELLHDAQDPRDAAPALESRALLRRLRALLERLSEDRRVIFILHEVEGHSLREAAALLGISLTAAKKRVWRARRELEALAREDPALAPLLDRDGPDGGGDG